MEMMPSVLLTSFMRCAPKTFIYGSRRLVLIQLVCFTCKVLDGLLPHVRRKCVSTVYGICDRQAILPKLLEIPLSHDLNEYPLYHGGWTDVWKGLYNEKEVAFKALRVYSRGEHLIRRVGAPGLLWPYRSLTMTHAEVLPGGRDVESPSSRECASAVGCHKVRDPACHGIRLDGEREH